MDCQAIIAGFSCTQSNVKMLHVRAGHECMPYGRTQRKYVIINAYIIHHLHIIMLQQCHVRHGSQGH